MKTNLIIVLLSIAFINNIIAQTVEFEEVRAVAPLPTNIADFVGVSNSSIAFVDVDGDNDEDVIIVGNLQNHYNNIIDASLLYINDGDGNYSLQEESPFVEVCYGSVAFADVDGDNDQDVLISGRDSSNQGNTELYLNDGSGNFSLHEDSPFIGVSYSSVAFGDVDGDNDQDVLITGLGDSGRISNLYINDGSGNYSLVEESPFFARSHGSVAFADIDGDTDLDLLISGGNGYGQSFTELYVNDGLGNFSLFEGTPFIGVSFSSVSFADIDGDNDQDLLISGQIEGAQEVMELYVNDGDGNFSLVIETLFDFEAIFFSVFADVDGDNDQDFLISGRNNSNKRVSKIYINDGSGNFSIDNEVILEGVYGGSIAFADIDRDNDKDLLITGSSGSGRISKLYINNGTGYFANNSVFKGVNYSSVAFADVDGDNDQDVLITGSTFNSDISELYINDGEGNYSLVNETPFDGFRKGSVAFADVDGDDDQDVFIIGLKTPFELISKLFLNDGDGNFFLSEGTPFEPVVGGSVEFADVDGDNDLDLLIAGESVSGSIPKLYYNDGEGNFILANESPFIGVKNCSLAFADVDGDDDLDVLMAGANSYENPITKLYFNDGEGNYSLQEETSFIGLSNSSLDFADVDGDDDLDVLITGVNSSGEGFSKLYMNDGSGNYAHNLDCPFVGVSDGSGVFADVDGDNDEDVLIVGYQYDSIYNGLISNIYINDSIGNYYLDSGNVFEGVSESSVAFSDIDNDNDQDVLITGRGFNGKISKLYRNLSINTIGILENEVNNKIKIFPNPSFGRIKIECEDLIKIKVFDMSAKLAKQIESSSDMIFVDLSDLKPGIYVLKIVSSKGISSQKIILE